MTLSSTDIDISTLSMQPTKIANHSLTTASDGRITLTTSAVWRRSHCW